MAEVMKVIKEIIVKGITKAKEIIEEIKKHFFPGGKNLSHKIYLIQFKQGPKYSTCCYSLVMFLHDLNSLLLVFI